MQKIQQLYKSEKYADCAQACLDLVKTTEDKTEPCLYYINSMLRLFSYPLQDDYVECICSMKKLGEGNCKTLKEYYEFNHRVHQEIDKWKVEYLCNSTISQLRSRPSTDNWKKHHDEKTKLIRWNIMLLLSSDNNHRKALEAKEGISTEEGEKKYANKAKFDYEGTLGTREYEAAEHIFELLTNYINNNSVCVNVDRMKTVGMSALDVFFVVKFLVEFSTNEFKENAPRIKFFTEVLRYYLNVTVNCGGHTVSLFLSESDRNQRYNELQNLYNTLKTLEPSFVAPPMPRLEAIDFTRTSSGSSGGGCYVATAVYGSYDCPEVWTLRRYRDTDLAETWYGRAFIRVYYAISPTLVKLFGDKKWFKNMWKGKLDKKVKKLQEKGYEDTPYTDRQW